MLNKVHFVSRHSLEKKKLKYTSQDVQNKSFSIIAIICQSAKYLESYYTIRFDEVTDISRTSWICNLLD